MKTFFLVLIGATTILSGCSREPDSVARLTVSPSTIVVRGGECTPVTLRWLPTAQLERREGNPTVFVHLLDGPHNLVRTFDHPLSFPWHVGTGVSYEIDICDSALASPLPPGMYNLKVGLYDDQLGYRWPLATNGVDAGARGYRVAQVVVPSTPGTVPKFTMAGPWGKREEVGDKQIRVRHSFSSGARLELEGVTSPGAVRFTLRLPDRAQGSTVVETTCGGRWSTSDRGLHVVELPVTSRDCAIVFTTPAEASIENLGWKVRER